MLELRADSDLGFTFFLVISIASLQQAQYEKATATSAGIEKNGHPLDSERNTRLNTLFSVANGMINDAVGKGRVVFAECARNLVCCPVFLPGRGQDQKNQWVQSPRKRANGGPRVRCSSRAAGVGR